MPTLLYDAVIVADVATRTSALPRLFLGSRIEYSSAPPVNQPTARFNQFN